MEHHTGITEKSEMFGGKRYRKVCHARSAVNAQKKVESLRDQGYAARREQEMRGHWNVYARRRK